MNAQETSSGEEQWKLKIHSTKWKDIRILNAFNSTYKRIMEEMWKDKHTVLRIINTSRTINDDGKHQNADFNIC